MPHVDGDDDGVGYGVYGNSGMASAGHVARCGRQEQVAAMACLARAPRQWCIWHLRRRLWCIWRQRQRHWSVWRERHDHAAILNGKVRITGNLEKAGGSFKIDHPLDPANKYLCHSFVESPDMKNVYDGVVVLDDKGEAEIELPDWFGALNKDFRYQLTAIGAPGPNLYIAEEIFLTLLLLLLQSMMAAITTTTAMMIAATMITTRTIEVASRLQEVLQP